MGYLWEMGMLSRIPKYQQKEKQDKVVWETHNRDWHWAYNLMLFGLFFGMFSLVSAGGQVLVSNYFLTRLVVFCCLFGLVIPLKLYNRFWQFGVWESVMFNLLGVGPLLCGLLLWINVLFRGEPTSELHAVTNARLSNQGISGEAKILFDLEGGAWEEYPSVRMLEFYQNERIVLQTQTLRINIAPGALGYPVWESTESVRPE